MTDAVGPQVEDAGRLPTFDRPPVVEVVIGVEFQPLAEFGAVRLVQLADGWRTEYPTIQEQPPLPMNAPVGEPGPSPQIFVNVGAPAIRQWLLTADGSRLLQIQRDRLILNWRLMDHTAPYPHYQTLLPHFINAFRDLTKFVNQQGLGRLSPLGIEVSYVNEVLGGERPPKLASILRAVDDDKVHIGAPVASRILTVYSASSQSGYPATLTLTAESEGRSPNSALVTLTYRSAVPVAAQESDVVAAMDLGHRDVVIAFAQATTDAMHSDWGRRS